MKIKICVVTGTRAEFGLLLPLMNLIRAKSQDFILQIVATGAHLSPEFGLTYREIEQSGFEIHEKVEMLLSSDTNTAITKSVGLGMIGIADVFVRLKPHWVVLLGDRFETFAAAGAAYLHKIPIAHLHGGETTEGALDEGLRHAITKLSYLHFTSTEVYRNRVIQMGESPDRVYNVGAIGLDNIFSMDLLSKQELSQVLDFPLDLYFALITFHPATLENAEPEDQFRELLKALDSFPNLNLIFTYPNSDAGGRRLIPLIKSYVEENSQRAKATENLGQLRYLSAMKHASVVLGNSSSGILEAPSFGVPSINIGDRQKGRIRSDLVIDVKADAFEISSAIQKAVYSDFRTLNSRSENPYWNGGASNKILDHLIKDLPLECPVKHFFNFSKGE